MPCPSVRSIPAHHRTLEAGLRKWVGEQTHFDLGYTEQLYTFGDSGRHLPRAGSKADARGVGRLSGADAPGQATAPKRRDTAGATGITIFPGRTGATPSPP